MIEVDERGIALPVRAYASTWGAARVVIALLLLNVVVDLIAAGSDIAAIRLFDRAIAGEFVSDAEFDRNDDRQGSIGLVQFALTIVTAVAYLVWQYRTYANLPALRAVDLGATPRWGVVAWFIPILNIWRPYQITAEMARASDPRYLNDDGIAWQGAPAPRPLGFWWAGWLLTLAFGRIATRFGLREPESLEDFRTQSVLWLASDMVDAIAALLAVLVVLRIAQFQTAKHRRIVAGHVPPMTRPSVLD